MTTEAISIRIKFEELDGWHIATSPDLPGFILADPNKQEIIDDLPLAIKTLYDARYNADCIVISSKYGNPKTRTKAAPWFIVPKSLTQNIAVAMA